MTLRKPWVGYKVHLTETYDEQLPRIITIVKTTLATTDDGDMTTPIHEALQTRDLLPADHLVDTAYIDAELLVSSQESYGVNLVGPTHIDTSWQANRLRLASLLKISRSIGKNKPVLAALT